MKQKKRAESDKVIDCIVKGIQEKKGKEILSIDLSKLDNAVCRYFIICHGDSNTQVNAIAQSIEKVMQEDLHENVWHSQGYENAQWILLDYFDYMVHIFQKDTRDFYNLESLWADGQIQHFTEVLVN
ncbi:MAG TPA: ribosome silencing factor [Bacteroidales bacterium]|nr:ribosome silencing factor [Bacteroidales bacterium]